MTFCRTNVCVRFLEWTGKTECLTKTLGRWQALSPQSGWTEEKVLIYWVHNDVAKRRKKEVRSAEFKIWRGTVKKEREKAGLKKWEAVRVKAKD